MAFDNAPSSVHLDQILTNLTLNYVTDQNFIANRVFPVLDVEYKSDEFYKFDPDEANRELDDDMLLAPRTEPRKFDVSHGKDSYMAQVRGLAFDIDTQTAANEDEQLNVRQRKANELMHKLMLRRDRDFLNTFVTSGVWSEDLDGSSSDFTQWSDSSSTPIDDVRQWKRDFQIRNYGFRPNKMLVTQDVLDELMANTQILGRINGGATIGNPALVDMALLAGIIVFVGGFTVATLPNMFNAFLSGEYSFTVFGGFATRITNSVVGGTLQNVLGDPLTAEKIRNSNLGPFTTRYHWNQYDNEINNQFVENHAATYDVVPDLFTSGAFTAASAVVQAVESEGEVSRDAIVSGMRGMTVDDTPKGEGAYTFQEYNNQARSQMTVANVEVTPDDQENWPAPIMPGSPVETVPAEDVTIPASEISCDLS